MKTPVSVPDIGDFKNIPVLEILVAVGQRVAAETPLLVMESDKATLEMPSPAEGVITEIMVQTGDLVSQGSLVMMLETAPAPATPAPATPAPAAAGPHAQFLVIGAGPGGYTAAFRAADLGLAVVLVDRGETLGGVCLNVGCIPSKALLHAAKLIDDAADFAGHGVKFGAPEVDLDKLRGWKDGVVGKLTGGLTGLARQRKVTVIKGEAVFTSAHTVEVKTDSGSQTLGFDQAVIAVGSEPATLPFIPRHPRIIDSSGALRLDAIPGRLLILGGGVIGLEMAAIYHALGARVTIAEFTSQIIPGADPDIVAPLMKRIAGRYQAIRLQTKVTAVEASDHEVTARFETPEGVLTESFDLLLVAVGRVSNGQKVKPEAAGVIADERGIIPVDPRMRTNVAHIFAIGDVVGQPMLAHKAVHQGRVAAEVASGQPSAFDTALIPAVAYTDPEVAWVGMTETQAKAAGAPYGKGVFPWAASGRSLSLGRAEGITKLLFDEASGRIIGAGIVGPHAGDLIAEIVLAIEMGADAADIALSIHPHPTLSETIGMAADAFEGKLTDLYLPRRPH